MLLLPDRRIRREEILEEIRFQELLSIVRDVVERVVYEKICGALRRFQASPLHHVMNAHHKMGHVVRSSEGNMPSCLNRRSVVGTFLRKLIFALNIAGFPEMVKFSKALLDYLDTGARGELPEETAIRRLSVSLQDISLAMDTSEAAKLYGSSTEDSKQTKWERTRARAYLTAQAEKFRDNSGRVTRPKRLQGEIEEMIGEDPKLIDAYYIAFLNQMVFGEYNVALENCHNFFLSKRIETSLKFRHALLNLAIFHSKFNHIKQAELALKECIKLCQQAGDTKTLKQAYNWLHCIDYDACNPGSDATRRCFDHLRTLYIARYKNRLGQILPSEESLRQCFERLDRLWLNPKTTGSASMIAHNVTEVFLWLGYGFHENARLHCEMILHLSHTKVTSEHKGEIIMNDSTALALVLSARYEMANYEVSRADEFMNIATSLVPEPACDLRSMIDMGILNVAAEKALRKEQYHECQDIIEAMSLMSTSVADVYRARMFFRKGNYQFALKILEKCESEQTDNPSYPIRGLLKARILAAIKSDRVVMCILEYVADCERYNLRYLAAMLKLELVRFQNKNGSSHEITKSTLDSIAPLILAQGSLEDKLYFERVVAETALSPQEAVERLDACYMEWKAKEDLYNQRLVLNDLARMCGRLGLIERRNRYATLLKQMVTATRSTQD